MAEGRVACNAIQPRCQVLRVTQRANALDDSHPGFLEDVPGVSLVANQAPAEIQETRLPGADQFLQSGPVPTAAAKRKQLTCHALFVARQAISLQEPLLVQTLPAV